jgi:5-methylcytosine-specific restriction endonuclease McrA
MSQERRRAATNCEELRRIREAFAEGRHSEQEWRTLVERLGGRCLRCGTQADLTKDHVVPLSRGGSNRLENLQPLCRRCNSGKHERIIDFRDHFISQTRSLSRRPQLPSPGPGGEG